MRRSVPYFIALIAVLCAVSCSNDFLEDNKKEIDGYELDASLLVVPSQTYTEVSITLPDLKNKSFSVFKYPQIIHFDSFKGKIDETGKLTLNIKVDDFHTEVSPDIYSIGEIILNIEGFGLLQIDVQHQNYGNPEASLSTDLIDFYIHHNAPDFEIQNKKNGILFYKLAECPSWITLDSWSSTPLEMGEIQSVMQYGAASFRVTPVTNNLESGIHEGNIVFETSDLANRRLTVKVKIKIRDYRNPDSMIPIEGVVADAKMDKSTNTLILVTQNPAKLITYNVDTKIKREKELQYNPYAINLSSDGKTILLGESKNLEFVDFASLSTKENIEVNFIVSDIVDGENGFYYFANEKKEIYSFNATSKFIKKQIDNGDFSWNLIEGEKLVKIKNKPFLASTIKSQSPNGLYLLDISDPENMKRKKYWHESFGGMLLTSEDQKQLYSFRSSVYQFPDENSENIYSTGEMKTKFQSYINFDWIHHASSTATIWGSYVFYDQENYKYVNAVTGFNDHTLQEGKTYLLNDYVTTINGKKDYYSTKASFFFAIKNGNELVLIKNVNNTYDFNAWHIETIDVTK